MITIALPPVFDLSAVMALTTQLLAATDAVRIDAGEVNRIGIAGLQLLLCARATADVAGQPMTIDRPSDAMQEAARLAGVDTLLFSPSAC